MNRDEIGALEEVIQADQSHVEELGPLHRDHRVVRDDVHLQPMRAFRHLRAHVAETDDAERLATNLRADEFRACPLSSPHRRIRLRHPAREREQERDRVLGGGHDIAARRVDDEDAFARGCGDVDVVDPDAGAADDAELAAGVDDRCRDARLAADDQRVEVRDPADQLRFVELADHGHLAGAAKSLEAVFGQRVGDEDLCHRGRAA